MKVTTLSLMTMLALGYMGSVNAEVKLESAADIIGVWKVDAEAAKYDGEKKAINVVWEFKDGGVLNTISKDPRTSSFSVPLTYSVEDGMIKKQSVPGRQKFESCTVLKKTPNSMDIKCTYLYFFLTKQ
jgi:hypothetical protein